MDTEHAVEPTQPLREPWSAPVLRRLSAVNAEASEGPGGDGGLVS
jgi:hypothetical protein